MKKVILFLLGHILIFGFAETVKVSAASSRTVIKITSKNPDKPVSVGVSYRTAGADEFSQRQTPFETTIEAEFINGSFIKLAGEGKFKVEVFENLVDDADKKKNFHIWGEGEFVNINTEMNGEKKHYHLSASSEEKFIENIRRFFEKFKVGETERLDLSLENKTSVSGYIREFHKNGIVFADEKKGLFSLIPYSKIKTIEKHKSLTAYDELKQNPSLKTYWENFFARKLNNAVYGYSYAVYRNGKPIAVSSYGYDKLPSSPDDSGVPLMPKTLIQIASVSKPITAVALLHLLEKKGIPTETKFWTILKPLFPDLEPGKGVDEITIAQLLSHKSGYKFGYVETPRIENLRKLFSEAVPEEIGKNYVYSNINFSIARTLIEQISGKSYERYVREEIFNPVGAKNVSLNVDRENASNIYLINNPKGEPLAVDYRDEAGAYGWYAAAEAIAKFAEGVRSNKFLSSQMKQKMFENNLGWGTQRTPVGEVYRHEGQWVVPGNKGIHSGIAIFPDGTEAVLLINTNGRFSASGLLVDAYTENIPVMRGYPYPGNKSVGIVRVEIPANSEEVRCTTDNTEPDSSSPVYLKPITAPLPLNIKCRGFIGKTPVTFTNTVKVNMAKEK